MRYPIRNATGMGFDSEGSLADFGEIETQFKMSCSLLVNQGRWPDAPLSP